MKHYLMTSTTYKKGNHILDQSNKLSELVVNAIDK